MRLISALLVSSCFVLPVAAQADEPSVKGTLLEISAQAETKASPDIATISSGVVTINKSADGAMKDNAAKMTAVFAAIEKAGIEQKDVQTAGVSLNPQYNYVQNQPPQIVNYQANNNVTVKIRDMKKIGPVLDALIAQGANQLNGPTFGIDKPETLQDEARQEAMKKAMARANLYATATGMKVKRIVSINESAGMERPPMPMMMAARASAKMEDASTPVATGEVGLSVTVNVTFELE